MSDVDAVHPSRAALQQAVCEAAGGQPGVQGGAAGDINAIVRKRSVQLQTCPAGTPETASISTPALVDTTTCRVRP